MMKTRLQQLLLLLALMLCLPAQAVAQTDGDELDNDSIIELPMMYDQRAVFFYKNDGQFRAFFDSEIDSILYSCYDEELNLYPYPVTQHVYARDSLYIFPIAATDSIGFVSPAVEYRDNVVLMDEEYEDYVIMYDAYELRLSLATPPHLLPEVGNIVFSEEVFPKLIGRVVAVHMTPKYYRCELELDDLSPKSVYARLTGMFSSTQVQTPDGQTVRINATSLPPRRNDGKPEELDKKLSALVAIRAWLAKYGFKIEGTSLFNEDGFKLKYTKLEFSPIDFLNDGDPNPFQFKGGFYPFAKLAMPVEFNIGEDEPLHFGINLAGGATAEIVGYIKNFEDKKAENVTIPLFDPDNKEYKKKWPKKDFAIGYGFFVDLQLFKPFVDLILSSEFKASITGEAGVNFAMDVDFGKGEVRGGLEGGRYFTPYTKWSSDVHWDPLDIELRVGNKPTIGLFWGTELLDMVSLSWKIAAVADFGFGFGGEGGGTDEWDEEYDDRNYTSPKFTTWSRLHCGIGWNLREFELAFNIGPKYYQITDLKVPFDFMEGRFLDFKGVPEIGKMKCDGIRYFDGKAMGKFSYEVSGNTLLKWNYGMGLYEDLGGTNLKLVRAFDSGETYPTWSKSSPRTYSVFIDNIDIDKSYVVCAMLVDPDKKMEKGMITDSWYAFNTYENVKVENVEPGEVTADLTLKMEGLLDGIEFDGEVPSFDVGIAFIDAGRSYKETDDFQFSELENCKYVEYKHLYRKDIEEAIKNNYTYTYTLKGLNEGSKYFCCIYKDTRVPGQRIIYSAPRSFITKGEAFHIDAFQPTSVTSTSINPRVYVTWNPANGDKGKKLKIILRYARDVDLLSSMAQPWKEALCQAKLVPGNTYEVELKNLQPDTKYHYYFIARHDDMDDYMKTKEDVCTTKPPIQSSKQYLKSLEVAEIAKVSNNKVKIEIRADWPDDTYSNAEIGIVLSRYTDNPDEVVLGGDNVICKALDTKYQKSKGRWRTREMANLQADKKYTIRPYLKLSNREITEGGYGFESFDEFDAPRTVTIDGESVELATGIKYGPALSFIRTGKNNEVNVWDPCFGHPQMTKRKFIYIDMKDLGDRGEEATYLLASYDCDQLKKRNATRLRGNWVKNKKKVRALRRVQGVDEDDEDRAVMEFDASTFEHSDVLYVRPAFENEEGEIMYGETTMVSVDDLEGLDEEDEEEQEADTEVATEFSFVDMGLSVDWANKNLGAINESRYGNYYQWADPAPGTLFSEAGYSTEDIKDGTIAGNIKYDAATKELGTNYHIPTTVEWNELIENCLWEYTSVNGVMGYKAYSMKNGNTVFFPSAGVMHDRTGYDQGSCGCYWSATQSAGVTDQNGNIAVNPELEADRMHFDRTTYTDNTKPKMLPGSKYYGRSIRPVKKKDK